MDLFRLFIGSNNVTKKLELSKIEAVTLKYFDGFTLTKSTGVWKGEHERTAIVEVMSHPDDRSKVYALAQELKSVLEQEAVLVQVSTPFVNFI